MNEMENSKSAENREFFRATGLVYLLLKPIVGVSLLRQNMDSLPEQADPLLLKILNLKSQILYHSPEHSDYYLKLIDLMTQIQNQKTNSETFVYAQKKWVVISASGIDFFSDTLHLVDEQLMAEITFTSYPYTSLSLKAKVRRCERKNNPKEGRYHVAMQFIDLNEKEQEQLIKFVNHLERNKNQQKPKLPAIRLVP